MAEKESKDTIEIRHVKSPHFTNHFATGGLITGPSSDNMYHLIFHADIIEVKYETGKLIGNSETSYNTKVERKARDIFREDQVRITLSLEALKGLSKALHQNYPASNDSK